MTEVAEDGLVLKAVKELSLSSNIILVDVSQVTGGGCKIWQGNQKKTLHKIIDTDA